MKSLYPLLLLLTLLPPVQGCAALGGSVPRAAGAIAAEMDRQIIDRFGEKKEGLPAIVPNESRLRELRGRFTIIGTTPVNLNDLEQSCPLARQMSEEMSRWFIKAGYKYQELRKGKEIFIHKRRGETILTRDVDLLAARNATSEAILTGTYLLSPDQARFSMRLIHTPGNEVLAMGAATVSITEDVRPLLADTESGGPIKVTPSISTRLQ